MQQPSLFVLIGNILKSLAFRELFRTKKAGKFRSKRHTSEIYLYLNAFSIFHSRLILIIDSDLLKQGLRTKVPLAEKCHNIIRQALPRPTADLCINLDKTTDNIYSYLLLSFTDVFCFFSVNLGGFKQIICCLAV
jgi:hypothetical protein